MAKPVKTLVIDNHGKLTVMETRMIPWNCKGTSEHKVEKIKQEIEQCL